MATVTLESGTSELLDPAAAADEALAHLGGTTAQVVLGFVAGERDHRAQHAALRERLPKGTRLVTSTVAATVTNAGYRESSLVVGALSGDLEVGIGSGTGLGRDPSKLGADCVANAARELSVRPEDMDRSFVGVVLDDGSRMKKEEMLLGALERNQGLVVVGGGATKNEYGQAGFLGVDGEVFDDGALLLLFRTKARWAALRHHAFEPTGQRVRVTKFDGATSRILELDGEPAALRAAKLFDIPPEHMEMRNVPELLKVMFALRVGREFFLRFAFKDDTNALVSVNWLQEGQELELMRRGNMLTAAQRFMDAELSNRIASPTAALFFDCAARKVSATLGGVVDGVGGTFGAAPPCVGGVVHHESYCGFMVSGTLTALVFGADA